MTLAKEIRMKNEIESVRHEALLNLIRTASLLGKVSNTFFIKHHLTEAQYNVLIVLKIEGIALNQMEIGERLLTSRANITSLIDKLETKQYVKREEVESDRRIYKINLTEKGKHLLEKVEKAYVEKVEEIMSCIGLAECKTISRSLEKLRESLRSMELQGK